jgi:hypothetical protein
MRLQQRNEGKGYLGEREDISVINRDFFDMLAKRYVERVFLLTEIESGRKRSCVSFGLLE